MTNHHPKLDEGGKSIQILHPSHPTPESCWSTPSDTATVVPGGSMPAELNGVAFQPWQAPTTDAEWDQVEGQADFDEPPFITPPGKKPAAGVVIEEPDGRVWLVSLTNGHGGYSTTFPKGRLEAGASLQVTAIREAYEKSGLQVKLKAHFADSNRDTTFTRLYRAQRISGSPTDCSWESQAVHLVPRSKLAELLTHPNDKPLVDALRMAAPRREELLKMTTLDSAKRIVVAVTCYRHRFGKWPGTLLIHAGTAEAIQKLVLTQLGWQMLNARLKVIEIEKGTVIAKGDDGTSFDYENWDHQFPTNGERADVWIWGSRLAD
jgi:ADP-ribose pyrophosphatase YjhB (NUDIX family)